ncbi:MAG: sigma-54-dependent Fis family transcriptional regulator [Rikenellaceae bacterium]|nr:sigma-54-dependent Fis family transcriptional regulator [Rikenellaceae bacterium]
MTKEGNLLIVDDNRSIVSALSLLLGRYFAKVVTLPSPNQIVTKLREECIDVVLLDMNFSAGINTGNEGLYWLRQIKQINSDIQVVLFTAYADIELAVSGIKEGAADFVVKPWDNEKLIASLQNAFNLRKSRREVKHLKEIKRELINESPMFWGRSEVMKRLHETIDKVAVTDANILITGENGTGKEMMAREIHNLSPRRNELLVSVDMGAVAETLFESELFGHVKGAFTDARSDRAGKFEVAHGGTLFLDEIGNLPYHLQAKLLAALQNNRIVRVGSNTPIDVDIRLICATNRNLHEMVARSEFREDLLYRVNTIHIDIPPLRERREDIEELAGLFLRKYAAKYHKSIPGFDRGACRAMEEHPWQGNIRELQHTVEKAVILSDGGAITASALMLSAARPPVAPKAEFTTLEQMERAMIENAMKRHRGNLSAVASQLGITRQTLYNKIKRYEL